MGNRLTQSQVIEKAVRALGGTWDTSRAVTVLRDAGLTWRDRRAAEKAARDALRNLRDAGLLVKTQDRPVEYRTSIA